MSSNGIVRGETLSEADLVLRARGGEGAAWEAIVGHHREAVFRYAFLQLGDAAEAEDVAQEAFIRAYRAFHRFDPARPLRPWLLRIARNVARNRWRSWMRRVRATERWRHEVEREVAAEGSPSLDGMAEAAAQLKGIVEGLREPDRQVIYLRFFLGLSLEETGEALSLPVGTVKSRLSRALERLRDTVQASYPALRQVLEE
jgi:RNA polymerase sigma-70 factor (ECF subfamily)